MQFCGGSLPDASFSLPRVDYQADIEDAKKKKQLSWCSGKIPLTKKGEGREART